MPQTGKREIAPGVHVFTSGAYSLNSGVILGTRQRGALLVDPGLFPAEIERIAGFLASPKSGTAWIALTHSDWDHVAGTSRWPEAAVVASSEFPARAAAEGAAIERALAAFDRRLYVRREPPFALPRPASLAGSPCDLVWEGPRVHLFPARGHTPDGMMLQLTERRILFAGDHLSDREIPFVGESIGAYMDTLAIVRGLANRGEIDLLVPGHGDICGRVEILERIEEDTDYLARLGAWVRETSRTVNSLEGILDRADEVVFRKGADNSDVIAEHRINIERTARTLGIA